MRKCIFYLPYKLEDKGKGARMLRPKKMIQAFRDIGYDVFVITGDSAQRRHQIQEIKKRIKNGEKYDFMYTESHTEPTLLTDRNHLPTHPFLDFGFFKYINKQGIKIGLFYCDIYWKFGSYGANLPAWKRRGALICYRYDVIQYRKYLNKFYVPDLKICDYLEDDKLRAIASELPPGADNISIDDTNVNNSHEADNKPLTVFYVGGLGSQYQIIELVKAVFVTENTRLIICCREDEWRQQEALYSPYESDRIKIIHKNSDELEPYYREADVCSLLFLNDAYREMAKPFKAFEYLAHEKPVLSTKGTAIGDFVESNDIGWNIEFKSDAISNVLKAILADPDILEEKKKNCIKTKKTNLWTSRAKQVAKDLVTKDF